MSEGYDYPDSAEMRRRVERFLDGAKEKYIDQLVQGCRDIALMPWWKRMFFARRRALVALGHMVSYNPNVDLQPGMLDASNVTGWKGKT